MIGVGIGHTDDGGLRARGGGGENNLREENGC